MDPFSISIGVVALITVCVQTIKVIKKTIETVKTAKKELLRILNATNRMRLLLEQLRGLTHQLGGKNNKVLLAFDHAGCEEILGEVKRLIDKLAQVELFTGFQFLVRRSKFEALLAGLKVQESSIQTVLLSVATESAVFTREYVEKMIDEANVQATSISSITQNPVDVTDEPPPPFTEHAESSDVTNELLDKFGPSTKSVLADTPGIVKMVTTLESQDKVQIDALHAEDLISLAETEPRSTATMGEQPALETSAGLWSPPVKENSILWLASSPKASSGTSKKKCTTPIIPKFPKVLSTALIWHGQLSRKLFDDEYLRLRDRLADAAYGGDWDGVLTTIDTASKHELKSWANCYRIGSAIGPSGWTPLHQAAYLSAQEPEVRELVNLGASRTLRTVWTSPGDLPFRNMTALEIARFLGFKHLFKILSPIIHHPVPGAVLFKLQENFHCLIRDDLADWPVEANVRLPELELLTELDVPEMYFPLRSPKVAMGYFYRLDSRELLVMSLGFSSSGQPRYFRITEQDTQEIQDAVFF